MKERLIGQPADHPSIFPDDLKAINEANIFAVKILSNEQIELSNRLAA